MVRVALIGLALVLVLSLAFCGQERAKPAYFPLNEGWSWTYAVTTERSDSTEKTRFVVEALGAAEFHDETLFVRRTSEGTDYFMRVGKAGIERVAKRTLAQYVPIKDPEPRLVLPAEHKSGAGWSYLTPLFVLERVRQDSSDRQALLHGDPVLMNFSIEELDVEITTPAGAFFECLKVVGLAERNLFASPDQGFVVVPITQTEWYCKDVGLVRLVRDEPLVSDFTMGGTVTFELLTFETEK